jgi:hypothetical protein
MGIEMCLFEFHDELYDYYNSKNPIIKDKEEINDIEKQIFFDNYTELDLQLIEHIEKEKYYE